MAPNPAKNWAVQPASHLYTSPSTEPWSIKRAPVWPLC